LPQNAIKLVDMSIIQFIRAKVVGSSHKKTHTSYPVLNAGAYQPTSEFWESQIRLEDNSSKLPSNFNDEQTEEAIAKRDRNNIIQVPRKVTIYLKQALAANGSRDHLDPVQTQKAVKTRLRREWHMHVK
jgi:hypothetical protein